MNHRNRRGATIAASALIIGGLTVAAAGAPALAASAPDTSPLTDAITADGLQTHLEALQAIADDPANGGNRAAGTPGYLASLEYVEQTLQAAGYLTERQPFSYELIDYDGSTLDQTAPTPTSYAFFDEFYPFEFTGSGDVTAAVQAVDVNLEGDRASTSGCETTDFAGFVAGSIALIQRGSCDFSVKAANAVAAGAVGVIMFNQGNDDPSDDRFGVFNGTLSSATWTQNPVPVVSTSFDLGAELVGTEGLVMRLNVVTNSTSIDTWNLLADTPTGRTDRTVVVGAHLDSVPEGPGINDNGSGTAALMETALQLSSLGIETENRIRFAFWGGEEDGLIGSSYYVSQLSKAQIKQHLVNLNFDMLGSPNGGRFIYDGDGSGFGTTGPNGSDVIEGVFEDWFDARDLATEPTAFDGRSDYFAFIGAGIPAGGLFSGAEDIKSAEQAVKFGGTAGVAFDPCYHSPCDDIDNIDPVLFEQLADAAAHATLVFAETQSAVNGTAKGKALGKWSPGFKGSRALR